jgi:beta-glucosidase
MKKLTPFIFILLILAACKGPSDDVFQQEKEFEAYEPPISYEDARKRADSIVQLMSLDEKIAMIGGYNFFFTKGFEKYNIPALYFSDATQGVHIRKKLDDQLEKSVAFPCPIALTSTWNTQLAKEYATCIGEECRAGDIAVLLGPGMNIYRISQNGRNFEYFGEDPFLAARMIENYVVGMQSTGTISTLKHFITNNTDHRRRRANSVVDERTLHEIYMPAFEAGINAGAMAVMTSYNLVNGEHAGQSDYVINKLLRSDLGFKWLVMSDWWSVWDAEKVIKSGLDLDMPGEPQDWMPEYARKDEFYLRYTAKQLVEEGKVTEKDIERMVLNIITTEIAMGLQERPVKDSSFLDKFDEHVNKALETARESMVLLKNDSLLPLNPADDISVLLTGRFVNEIPRGGGSAEVEGYDLVSMLDALKEVFGDKINYIEKPTEEDIKKYSHVIYSAGTKDAEGWDMPFDLPDSVNKEILAIAGQNPNTLVILSSGGGVNMSPWNDKVAGIIYSWYPGQVGFKALAEIITGVTNPSGKLPISIEKSFKDSPGYPYVPEGEDLIGSWNEDIDITQPLYDIKYDEGVFVGYRWYEDQKIEPLYAFGYGLSYTTFEYSNLQISKPAIAANEKLNVKVDIENTGKVEGMEVVQLYVKDLEASVKRPAKELKDFRKVNLKPGEKKTVYFTLTKRDFAFWDVESASWKVESGKFEILVGKASNDIQLTTGFEVK